MRTIDQDGQLLCELQAEAFALSVEKAAVSSAVFVRRYMRSEAAKWLDSGAALASGIQPADLLQLVEEQYGPSDYGSQKYTRDEMYWMGYLYRYFAFTYEESSAGVYKILKPDELRGLFLPYHTLDPVQAIERILEAKGRTAGTELRRQYDIFKRIREEGVPKRPGSRGGAGSKRTFRSAKEREDYLMETLRGQGVVIRRDVEKTLAVSQPTAVLILRKLVEDGRLVREGAGRNVWYTIPESKAEKGTSC